MSPSADGIVNSLSESMEESSDKETRTPATPPAIDVTAQMPDGSKTLPRSAVGQIMNDISAIVNDNLIAFRYGAVASISLLTAYGLSNTPLFFRFRNVAEIPSSFFVGRRRLYCRVIGVDHRSATSSGTADLSIQLMVRNLSPIGLLLPASWFEFLMRVSPSSRFSQGLLKQNKPEENKNELLRIHLAGIQTPPVSRLSYNPDTFLESLARERTLVSCQLLGRVVPILKTGGNETMTSPSASKRQYTRVPSPSDESNSNKIDEVSQALDLMTYNGEQIALCRLTYRPQIWQLFSTDIAETLVRSGNASVSSTMFGATSADHAAPTKIVDSSQRLQDLRHDVRYLDRLAATEFEAAKKSAGMWSVPEVREMKKEVVEEVNFQTKANIFQKLWRRLRNS
jgi:hypothetical protein